MAWHDTVEALNGRVLIGELPLGGKGVAVEEADDRVARWAARLEYEPETARQIALATELVATGARADLERLQLRRSGRLETPNADTARREANEMLATYNAMKVTADEETEVPPGYVGWMSW